jgi:nicotinamidase-related amidase
LPIVLLSQLGIPLILDDSTDTLAPMIQQLSPESTAILLVDVQEKLAAAMSPEKLARVLNRTQACLTGAKALGVKVCVTEQYSKGLGPTHASLTPLFESFKPVEKMEFSALVPDIRNQLKGLKNVVVLGMETHVCIFQTVRALQAHQFNTFVAADAVLSRNEIDFSTGLSLCQSTGAQLTTVEAVLFDMLQRAGGSAFKSVSNAVK